MTIGTSNGLAFEDEFQHSAGVEIPPPETKDNNVIDPETTPDIGTRDKNEVPLKRDGTVGPAKVIEAADKPYTGSNLGPLSRYDTKLPPEDETKFQEWKQQNAPNDSGEDYDLRGAYQAGLEKDIASGHWPDTYKKPNHPTFSDQSIYAKDRPDLAGTWDGDRYIPNIENVPHHDWVENFLSKAKEAFKLPGDVFGGKVDPSSTQGIEKAADLAGLMVFGPAPVASKMAEGTLGSFAGVRSKTVDMNKLNTAKDLDMQGVHQDDIWQQTGFFRAADNHWKYEIPDNKAELNFSKLYNLGGEVGINPAKPARPIPSNYPQTMEGVQKWIADNKAFQNPQMKLKDLLDHPELYKAYPWLADRPVRPMPPNVSGLGQNSPEAIYVGQQSAEEFRQTLLHEIQHSIQGHEGFSTGGSPNAYMPEGFIKLRDTVKNEIKDTVSKLKERGIPPEGIDSLWNAAKQELAGDMNSKLKDLIKNHPAYPEYTKLKELVKTAEAVDKTAKEAFQTYERLMGEVEARNVEARSRMTNFHRHFMSPENTEKNELGINRGEQLGDEFTAKHSSSEKPPEPITFRRAANENLPEGHPDRPYNVREPGMIGSKAMDDHLDNQWKDFGELMKQENLLRDQRMALINKNAPTKENPKGGWNEFDTARFNKLNDQIQDLYGEPHLPPVE